MEVIWLSCCWKRAIRFMASRGVRAALTPAGSILYQDPHESDPRLVLHGDLTDSTNLIRIIQQVQPDEIYNLGAQSHVAVSFESGIHSEWRCSGHAADPGGSENSRLNAQTRIYQAALVSSTAWCRRFQKESTPFTRAVPMEWPSSMPIGSRELPGELWDVCLQWSAV